MKRTSPLKRLHWILAGLSVATVLGSGFYSIRPVEDRPASSAPRLIVDGQETHGGGGGKGGRRATIRVADGNGQETHGGKGGKGIA